MSFKNLLGQTVENNIDDEMSRRHTYNYRYIKNMYPNVYKLPEKEINSMLDIVYKAPDLDQVNSGLQNHIKQNQQRWETDFLSPKKPATNPSTATNLAQTGNVQNLATNPNASAMPNLAATMPKFEPAMNFLNPQPIISPSAPTWQVASSSQNMEIPSMAQNQKMSAPTQQTITPIPMTETIEGTNLSKCGIEISDKELAKEFYKHLRKPGIEGYSQQMYCDTEANPTVGVGLMIPNNPWLDKISMFSTKDDVGDPNQMLTPLAKYKSLSDMREFCTSGSLNENGEMEMHKEMSLKAQREKFKKKYGYEIPYFDEAKLEELSKDYILHDTLPRIRQEMKNIGLDFDQLPNTAKFALMDLAYNLAPKKFRLGHGKVEEGYWNYLTDDLLAGRYDLAAGQVHRYNIGKKRNDATQDLMGDAARCLR